MQPPPPLYVRARRLRVGQGVGQIDETAPCLASVSHHHLMQVNRLDKRRQRLATRGIGLHPQR